MEITWRGKYRPDGQREVPKALLAPPSQPAVVQASQFYSADNLEFLSSQLADFYQAIDLIYIDPPFAVGSDFKMGDQVAYTDKWVDMDDYLSFMDVRLQLMRACLKPTGSMYVHCDYRAAAHLRLMLEDIFGADCFLNEIVWCYGLGGSSPRYWPRKHDTILWFSRFPNAHFFEPSWVPAKSQRMKGQMKKAPDYWMIPSLNNMAKERLDYPTQKPEKLLERIIESSCPVGGVVADFFCGSGTTLSVAQRLGRLAIGTDSSPVSANVVRERLGL